MYTMLVSTVSISLLLLITVVGSARLHDSRELIEGNCAIFFYLTTCIKEFRI